MILLWPYSGPEGWDHLDGCFFFFFFRFFQRLRKSGIEMARFQSVWNRFQDVPGRLELVFFGVELAPLWFKSFATFGLSA